MLQRSNVYSCIHLPLLSPSPFSLSFLPLPLSLLPLPPSFPPSFPPSSPLPPSLSDQIVEMLKLFSLPLPVVSAAVNTITLIISSFTSSLVQYQVRYNKCILMVLVGTGLSLSPRLCIDFKVIIWPSPSPLATSRLSSSSRWYCLVRFCMWLAFFLRRRWAAFWPLC